MSKTWRKVRGLGWLSFPAAVLVLLAILCLTWSTPVTAQGTWVSYRDVDHVFEWGDIANPYNATYTIVYMYGEGWTGNARFNIGYYDDGGNLIASDLSVKVPPQTLDLTSEYDLYLGGAGGFGSAGTWHCSVYDSALTLPATYQGDGIANVAFEVLAEAIPEFPTVLSAIAVAILCGVVYLWMRKKTGHAQA